MRGRILDGVMSRTAHIVVRTAVGAVLGVGVAALAQWTTGSTIGSNTRSMVVRR
jgi:hypothetical protein